MTQLDKLKASNAWDQNKNLPTVPMHLNPLIYLAYCMRVLRGHGEEVDQTVIATHLASMEIEPGLLNTYMSHDELLGAAYASPEFSARALDFLKKNWGFYPKEKTAANFIYKFVFMVPAMKAFAGQRVGILWQIALSLHILWELNFCKAGEANDRLKLWLMYRHVAPLLIAGPVIKYWANAWTRRGVTPKVIFTKNYLTEVPVIGELASESYGV